MAFKEFIKDFVTESTETLARLDQDFVEVEKNPTARERIESIYGGMHTIKGSAGFFAFHHLEAVAHSAESLMSAILDGKAKIDSGIISLLLAAVDAIRGMLCEVERSETDGTAEHAELLDKLAAARDGRAPAAAPAAAAPSGATPAGAAPPAAAPPAAAASAAAPPVLKPVPAPAESVPPPVQEVSLDKATAAESKEAGGNETGAEPPTPPEEEAEAAEQKVLDMTTRKVGASTIRVSIELLDRLMGLVGELVLARNQVIQYQSQLGDRSGVIAMQQLDLMTTELQQAVMKTRMQPISHLFSRFPRVVRDLALSCGKKVELLLEGTETELDKSLLEALSAPLTHLIRNAIDHGIEAPGVRQERGKKESGILRLSASHESGHVNIGVSDDGGGIDLNKVRHKAIQRGVVTREQAMAMGEAELLNLIFLPGFSTAERVSNLSGRGFGMDVVRTELDKIGGMVDIQTRYAQGTTLKIKIPLTLAIIPALIVTSRGDRYAIPQVNLREAVHIKAGQSKQKIELIHDTPVYRLRDRLLPLVDLGLELGYGPLGGEGGAAGGKGRGGAGGKGGGGAEGKGGNGAEGRAGSSAAAESVNIVVLHIDGREFGLIVDAIADTEEIVVKPIGRIVRGKSCFAGATIMEDGRPALILDVMGLAKRSRVLTKDLDRKIYDVHAETEAEKAGRASMLVFSTPAGGRMAMPLSRVWRLEVFPQSRVEKAGERDVVQYRDQIMPLVPIFRLLGDPAVEAGRQFLHVVVYEYLGRHVGMVVGQIVDIVEEQIEVKGLATRPGVLGTAVVKGRVTELLDPEGVLQMANLRLADSKGGVVEVKDYV